MSVSEKIRQAMADRGVSQPELAATLGMSLTQLARMLRNPDHNYEVKTLRRIASALGTTLEVDFGQTESVAVSDLAAGTEVTGGSYVFTASGGFVPRVESIPFEVKSVFFDMDIDIDTLTDERLLGYTTTTEQMRKALGYE